MSNTYRYPNFGFPRVFRPVFRNAGIPANRNFSDLNGTTQYFIIPSYTGSITLDVYPLVDVVGLPAGAPAVIANQWNTITFAVTALTDIGKNGASFFKGLIANISGTALDIPVALASGIEAPASLGATQPAVYLCEYLNGDWVDTHNLWTLGDYVSVDGVLGSTDFVNTAKQYYQYYTDVTNDSTDFPTKRLRLEVSQNDYYSIKQGRFANHKNYLTIPSDGYANIVMRPNNSIGGGTTSIRVSRAFKNSKPVVNYRFVQALGQSISVGAETIATAESLQPINTNFNFLSIGSEDTSLSSSLYTDYQGVREFSNTTTHAPIWGAMKALDSLGIGTDTIIAQSEGTPGAKLVTVAPRTANMVLMADAMVDMGHPTGTVTASALWCHGSANALDFATYAADLRQMHDDYLTNMQVVHPSLTKVNMFIVQQGGSNSWREPDLLNYAHARDNADAFLASPMYHITDQYPNDPPIDTVHLVVKGYDLVGEYWAKAMHAVEYGVGTWRPFEAISAVGSGNEITITFNVPVGNIVVDTTTIPAAAAHGITYERPAAGGTITPTITSVNSDNIVIDLGEAAGLGVVEFGANGSGTHGNPVINLRDQDTTIGSVTGDPLYNWMVIQNIDVTI